MASGRYCVSCKKPTRHKENRGFFGDLAVAIITGFKADLRDNTMTCTLCGKENKETI